MKRHVLRAAASLREFGLVKTLLAGSLLSLAVAWGSVIAPAQVWAQQSSSTNYSVDQAFFGNGGQLGVSGDGCSTNYCAKSAAGELGVGNVSSTNYQAQPGHNVNRDESLEVVVDNAACAGGGSTARDVGVLSPSSASTTTTNFSVKSYLSSGYSVRTAGAGPLNASGNPHILNLMTTGGTSTPGTEQFGINLRANTSPSVGADPAQLPDSTFGFGQAATGYNTANNFRYNNGDVIATSAKSSGTTCYTMSYLFNIASNTQGGQYVFNQSIVATASF